MASPSSHSPPYPSHAQLPAGTPGTPGTPGGNMANKKRAADSGAAASPALKRRKASAISTASGPPSAHPLRQTSFPPDDPATPYSARSPSADVDSVSLVSGSQVSAAAAPLRKKRGRKSKAEKAREQTPSVAGGRAPTAVSAASDAAAARSARSLVAGSAAAAGADDPDADEDGPTEVAATADLRTQEQKEEEHRVRGMLISAFSEEQFHRYENWRAANLSKASVRRVGTSPPSLARASLSLS